MKTSFSIPAHHFLLHLSILRCQQNYVPDQPRVENRLIRYCELIQYSVLYDIITPVRSQCIEILHS